MGCHFLIINAVPVMCQVGVWFVFHRKTLISRHHPFIAFIEVRLILERIIVCVVAAAMRVLAHLYVFDFRLDIGI